MAAFQIFLALILERIFEKDEVSQRKSIIILIKISEIFL